MSRSFKLAALRLVTVPLALVALLGTVELHSGAQLHTALEGPATIDLAAHHPTQPLHFEASAATAIPRCPACILQLQTLCAGLPAPHSPSQPMDSGRIAATSLPLPASLPLGSASSRGPPFA